jgi:nucleotide-binding universal stress UspA family protein
VEGAILDLLSHGDYDMVIIGTQKKELRKRNSFALEAEKLLQEAPCRVLFCKS